MRVGEVLALSPGDVTLEPGREGLLVRDPKNRHERLVILGPDATPKTLRGLKAWLRLNGSPSHHPPVCVQPGNPPFLQRGAVSVDLTLPQNQAG